MQREIDQLSTDKILSSTLQMIVEKHLHFPAAHLDIGSGAGSLIKWRIQARSATLNNARARG